MRGARVCIRACVDTLRSARLRTESQSGNITFSRREEQARSGLSSASLYIVLEKTPTFVKHLEMFTRTRLLSALTVFNAATSKPSSRFCYLTMKLQVHSVINILAFDNHCLYTKASDRIPWRLCAFVMIL